MPKETRIHLRSNYGQSAVESAHLVRAPLMGVLVDLARPVVRQYLSDHYYDAQWLSKYVQGPMEFFYGVREYGTDIGTDQQLIERFNEKAYLIELVWSEGSWDVVVTTTKNTKGD